MSKAAREMAILTLALLAALLIVVSDEPSYGLLLGSWALMGWFWFRNKQQKSLWMPVILTRKMSKPTGSSTAARR